jgi:hypothetical protein
MGFIPDEIPDGVKYKVVGFRLPDDYSQERANNRDNFRKNSHPELVEAVYAMAQQANDYIAVDVAGMDVKLTDLQRIVTSVLVAHNSLVLSLSNFAGREVNPEEQKIMTLVDLAIDAAIHELYPLIGARGGAS